MEAHASVRKGSGVGGGNYSQVSGATGPGAMGSDNHCRGMLLRRKLKRQWFHFSPGREPRLPPQPPFATMSAGGQAAAPTSPGLNQAHCVHLVSVLTPGPQLLSQSVTQVQCPVCWSWPGTALLHMQIWFRAHPPKVSDSCVPEQRFGNGHVASN